MARRALRGIEMENYEIERYENFLAVAGIPRRFKAARIKDLEDPKDRQGVMDWIYADGAWSSSVFPVDGRTYWKDSRWRCLVVNGNVGTGKTHLACGIVNEYCKRLPGLYTRAIDMSEAIMRERSSEFYKSRGLLVIDEINRTFDTAAEQQRIFDVLDYRYNAHVPTVLVGNFKGGDLRQRLGEALADRLMENLAVLTIKGKSHRTGEWSR